MGFDGRKYRYKSFSYDKSADALNYSNLDRARHGSESESKHLPEWVDAIVPTAAERLQMKRLGITYAVVQKNFEAVDQTLENLHEVKIPAKVSSLLTRREPVPPQAPDSVRDVLGKIILGDGDKLPVSAMPVDGTFPTATAQWEKRNLALEIPVWDSELCILCGKCVFVCPHAVIRSKVYEPSYLDQAPETFKSSNARWKEYADKKYTLQVSPEDCTGCVLCVEACPVKDKSQAGRKAINMAAQPPVRKAEKTNWEYFLSLPKMERSELNMKVIKNTQLLEPLFEFSGACSGCGETPYVKLLSQLFGDRLLVANATGCSSIYGGNLPTTPWAKNQEGRGPTWVDVHSLRGWRSGGFDFRAEQGIFAGEFHEREYGFLDRKIFRHNFFGEPL